MTYLQLMNHVLRRLREDEVTSVNASSYVQMVGDYINDAMRIVQDSWDWADLRNTIDITTSASTDTYSITGGSTDFKLFHIINDTSDTVLHQRSKAWMDERKLIDNDNEGAPSNFIFVQPDGSGDMQIKLYPTPDGVYTLKVNGVFRTDELTANDDTVPVPWQPVMHLAIALLAREKGEAGGTSAQEYFRIADRVLTTHIAREAAYFPEEKDWIPV